MKAEIYHFLDEDLSGVPHDTYDEIEGYLPLGENLLQIDVSRTETVLISGYAKAVFTRTPEEADEMEEAIMSLQKKQQMADLSSKYLSL